MATFYVKKDGSGTHQTIMGAMSVAVNGDTIEVEAGTFTENLDFYKDGITINGAGMDQTFIVGSTQTSVPKTGNLTTGSNVVSVPLGTSGMKAGHIVTGTGIPTNTRITGVSESSFTMSANATATRTNSAVTMAAIDSAVRWRGNNNKLKNVKVTDIPGRASKAVDNGCIYFRTAGLGAVAANNYWVENCHFVADGDMAIVSDNTGPGGGTITGCLIEGQTFSGPQPTQVSGFSSVSTSVNILTTNTIEVPSSFLVNVQVGSPILAVAGLVASSTTVSAISGTVLTLNKALLSGVGTSQSLTFTNIQFNVDNVARQLVVIQPSNTGPVYFTNNTVKGVTGGGVSYNTAVTVDAPNSIVTGNYFDGEYKFGYALRVRGAGSVVENNMNMSKPAKPNAGYLIGLIPGMSIGTNISVTKALLNSSQANAGDPIVNSIDKDTLKMVDRVSDDPVFSDETNWKMVSVIYKHDGSAKRLTQGFRDFSAEKGMKLKPGMQSGEKYELKRMIIRKSDRTMMVVDRSEISDASSFDFTLK
jgi:hypothetical protein